MDRLRSTHVGQIQEESVQQFIQNITEHPMASVLYIIDSTTKYDYNTKPHAFIKNYLRKQLRNRETKHC